MAVHGLPEAYQALVDRVKTITGPPSFYTNLTDRVYRKLWLPEDEKSELPYACIPLAGAIPTIPQADARLVKPHPIVPVYLFVAETSDSDKDGNAPDLLLKIVQDVIDALRADWQLGGKVENSEIVGLEVFAGENPEFLYGAARIDVQLELYAGDAELSP